MPPTSRTTIPTRTKHRGEPTSTPDCRFALQTVRVVVAAQHTAEAVQAEDAGVVLAVH